MILTITFQRKMKIMKIKKIIYLILILVALNNLTDKLEKILDTYLNISEIKIELIKSYQTSHNNNKS